MGFGAWVGFSRVWISKSGLLSPSGKNVSRHFNSTVSASRVRTRPPKIVQSFYKHCIQYNSVKVKVIFANTKLEKLFWGGGWIKICGVKLMPWQQFRIEPRNQIQKLAITSIISRMPQYSIDVNLHLNCYALVNLVDQLFKADW